MRARALFLEILLTLGASLCACSIARTYQVVSDVNRYNEMIELNARHCPEGAKTVGRGAQCQNERDVLLAYKLAIQQKRTADNLGGDVSSQKAALDGARAAAELLFPTVPK